MRFLTKKAGIINILGQLRLDNLKVEEKMETTKECKLENKGVICYRGIVIIFSSYLFFSAFLNFLALLSNLYLWVKFLLKSFQIFSFQQIFFLLSNISIFILPAVISNLRLRTHFLNAKSLKLDIKLKSWLVN